MNSKIKLIDEYIEKCEKCKDCSTFDAENGKTDEFLRAAHT